MRRILVLLWLASGAAQAAGTLHLTNVGPGGRDIPLQSGSVVYFDPDGSLRVECDLDDDDCKGTGGGPMPGTLPVSTLSRIDNDATLTAGESIRLAWSTSLADVCRASSSGAGSTAWSGPRAASNAGGELVALPQAGNYSFSLTCYNPAGGTTAASVSVVAAMADPQDPPPRQPSGCNIVSNDPAFQPAGWNRIDKTWKQTFSAPDGYPEADYPEAISWPVPVGSHRGSYTTVAFTPNPGESVNLHFAQVQARAFEYTIVRPAIGMFFSISPCPGDLRAPTYAGGDDFLREGCRKYASEASLIFTTLPQYQASDAGLCKLETGRTYYLNISPVDPAGGLTPGEHSCEDHPNSAIECHVGIVSGVSH